MTRFPGDDRRKGDGSPVRRYDGQRLVPASHAAVREIPVPGRKGFLRPHARHQPPRPRAEGRVDDVQFLVLGEQPALTRRTVIVRAPHRHGPQHGEHLLGAVAHELGLLSAGAGEARPALARVGVYQLLQHHPAHRVHGRAHPELRGAQRQRPVAAGRLPHAVYEAVDFARHLRLDERGNFFFSPRRQGDSLTSSTGRNRQIASFTSTRSSMARRNWW